MTPIFQNGFSSLSKRLSLMLAFTLLGFAGWQTGSHAFTKPFQLSSPAFHAEEAIPRRYTCDGTNISPPLVIQNIPKGTKSLALIVDDPDAPRGDWTHWLLWNIPPATRTIVESKPPAKAIVGINSFKHSAYGGPCPPVGIHHYYFTLYALDTLLKLPAASQKSALETAMHGHILNNAVLMGRYQHGSSQP